MFGKLRTERCSSQSCCLHQTHIPGGEPGNSKVKLKLQIKAMSDVKKDKSGKENPKWGGASLTFPKGPSPEVFL